MCLIQHPCLKELRQLRNGSLVLAFTSTNTKVVLHLEHLQSLLMDRPYKVIIWLSEIKLEFLKNNRVYCDDKIPVVKADNSSNIFALMYFL